MLGRIYFICNLDLGAERALTSLIIVQLFKSDFDGVFLDYVSDWLFRARTWALYILLNFYIHRRAQDAGTASTYHNNLSGFETGYTCRTLAECIGHSLFLDEARAGVAAQRRRWSRETAKMSVTPEAFTHDERALAARTFS